MIRKIFASGFMAILLCVPLLAADSNAGGQNTNTLPWEIIAEKFDAKEPFCSVKSKDKKTNNFAFAPDALNIELPSNIKILKKHTESELQLFAWQQDRWVDLPPIAVQVDPNCMTVDDNVIAEGFYNLLLIFDKNDVGKENNFYAIITAEWKKDLFAFCRKSKEQIETNPDPQLIYSSIAVSHLDNLMEMVNKSPVLSEHILSALSKAMKAKVNFEDGNCPDFVVGLNKIRLKRFEGSSIEEFVIAIPEIYSDSKAQAVFLLPDNRRWATQDNYLSRSGLIDIWWHTVENKNINWKNLQHFFEILKQKLNIDEDRIYVSGVCGNGLPAMSLALNFPDQWAECSVVLGNTYRHLAGNAFNLPLIFVRGTYDEGYLYGYYYFAAECFKYHGCRFFRHSDILNITDVRGSYVPTEIRDLSPYRVFYTIESLANPRAYWVQIGGREDENFTASIDAIVWGQKVLVETNNVDAYTLDLKLAPVDCNRPVDIIENGKHLDFVTGPVFTRKNPKFENALYIKDISMHGPVVDVFTDYYVVVWNGDENNSELAKHLAGSGPCFTDVNLPTDFIDTHNIVFVGKLHLSKHFIRAAGKFPVTIEDGKLKTDSEAYKGDFGVILIYPNPLNSKKYIAVFSGTSDKAMNMLDIAWEQIKSNKTADIAIYQVDENNKLKWLSSEKFDTVWGWHKSWNMPLAEITKKIF